MAEVSSNSLLLCLIPLIPLVASATAFVFGNSRRIAAGSAIAAQAIGACLSILLLTRVIGGAREVWNFTWFTFGDTPLRIGVALDPMTAAMLTMVTGVGLAIFIFSAGYMRKDERFVRFYAFLSFFSAAMLGIVVANSLLLLFICWELVGLASYLLIGYWYHKPAAAAAAKKAFLTTRVGDLGLFLGMVWLYAETGTTLFFDGGAGILESSTLANLAGATAVGGATAATVIALLIFCGAAGKSGQFPLHVWLPDAMEGPTPVSALIHAATMVAAGVFLVARMYPIFEVTSGPDGVSTALVAVAWVGSFTAVFSACLAVAQTNIKRILAYSTVSQLGFMMLALGVGGVTAAMLHLLAHAMFKALLFLGAGSVIEACEHEEDVRKMGGLFRRMPITFATYAVGMMALAGFPFFFSGFWSKEAILHAAREWPVSGVPFVLGLVAAFLTAFYMSRQMVYVFFGDYRAEGRRVPKENSRMMTAPLIALAVATVSLSAVLTPVWPWLAGFLEGVPADVDWSRLFGHGATGILVLSIVAVAAGVGGGWLLYGRRADRLSEGDPLEASVPVVYRALAQRLYVDAFYERTVVRGHHWLGRAAAFLDRFVWHGAVVLVTKFSLALSMLLSAIDRFLINRAFRSGCEVMRAASSWMARMRDGDAQGYLGYAAAGLVVLLLLFAWR